MKRFPLLLLTCACLSMLGACVAPVEDDLANLDEIAAPTAPEDEGQSVAQSALEAVEAPLCPDQVIRIPFTEDCTTPREEDGIRECTRTTVFHRTPVFKVTGMECKITSSTSTTRCGGCMPIILPDTDPEDLPPF